MDGSSVCLPAGGSPMSYRRSSTISRGIPLIALVSLQAAGCSNDDRDESPAGPLPTGEEMERAGGGTCGAMFDSLSPSDRARIFATARTVCTALDACDDEMTEDDVRMCVLRLTAGLTYYLPLDDACRDNEIAYYECWADEWDGRCETYSDPGYSDESYPYVDYEAVNDCQETLNEAWDQLGCSDLEHVECEFGDYDYDYVVVSSDAGVVEFDVTFPDETDTD